MTQQGTKVMVGYRHMDNTLDPERPGTVEGHWPGDEKGTFVKVLGVTQPVYMLDSRDDVKAEDWQGYYCYPI